jgi:deoxyuridine 5'-triphosphate nucleotidohydrolase
MSKFNNWKENILAMNHESVLVEFVRNVFNELGSINHRTVLNSDLEVRVDVSDIDTEIINHLVKFKGIKCELLTGKAFKTTPWTPRDFGTVNHDKFIYYTNHNALDFLGVIYSNTEPRYRNEILYRQYLDWLFFDKDIVTLPVCKFIKTHDLAVIPSRSRITDVGFDLTAISKVKDINSTTVMLETGIILEPQLGYFTKIYPRSSLVKSGYMLANSVGIIDATYRDTLKICLVKVNPEAPEIIFPFKCCQLIFEKQLHFTMEEQKDGMLESTARNMGGFGSTDLLKK